MAAHFVSFCYRHIYVVVYVARQWPANGSLARNTGGWLFHLGLRDNGLFLGSAEGGGVVVIWIKFYDNIPIVPFDCYATLVSGIILFAGVFQSHMFEPNEQGTHG